VIGVYPEGAQAYCTKLLITNRDGVGSPPMLVSLNSSREEVHIRLERRLEGFVPVLEVRQDWQGMSIKRVQTWRKRIGDLAFVHKQRHLGVSDRELAAILDLPILHRIAVSENSVAGFDPINNVNELLGQKVSKAHGCARFVAKRWGS